MILTTGKRTPIFNQEKFLLISTKNNLGKSWSIVTFEFQFLQERYHIRTLWIGNLWRLHPVKWYKCDPPTFQCIKVSNYLRRYFIRFNHHMKQTAKAEKQLEYYFKNRKVNILQQVRKQLSCLYPPTSRIQTLPDQILS